jgi:xanthine/uracil/vitamin C permease (AzgA family)
MKLKDIFMILFGLFLCAALAYMAFTAANWWEWIIIFLIIVFIGLHTKDYILRR